MIPYRRSWRCKDIKAPPRLCEKGKCVQTPPPVYQPTTAAQYDSTASKSEVIKKGFLDGELASANLFSPFNL